MLLLLISMLCGPLFEVPVPESLQRSIRTFDFEESTHHRLDLPQGFDRVVPHGTSGPAVFGTTRPATGSTRSGDYAFLFSLDGQSMAARTRPGMIPVRPGTDLGVSVWVRTDELHHAGVRLAAWLVDADGRQLGTATTSPFLEGTSDWTRLELVVDGRSLNAVELVTELQVLQRVHRTDVHSVLPPAIDVRGQVRFDDVAIVQRPSIRLDDGRPHGLHPHGTTPTLSMRLYDPIPEPALWSLVIEDDGGTVLARHAGPMPDREQIIQIEVPSPMRGWYRATLTAKTPEGMQAEDVLDFVVLAPNDGTPGSIGTLHLPQWPTDEDIHMATALGVATISLPFVDADGRAASDDDALRSRLDTYLDQGGSIEFHLNTLPESWCTELALDCRQITDFSLHGAHHWKPLVDDIAVHWGPAADHWRLGGDADGSTTTLWQNHLRLLVPDAVVHDARQRDDDLLPALRGDAALRITAPWVSDQSGRMRPTRDFPAHHTVLQALNGRRCTGMIRIAPETEGWVLEGDDGHDDALLVLRGDEKHDTNALALGEEAYRIDLDGNEWRLESRDGYQSWLEARTPFLIEGVERPLLRLQRDLQLQPQMLPARPRRHAHRIQVTNPWNTTMRGTLRFADDDRIRIEPPLLQIELAPGEQRDVDVDLLVTGPLALGPRPIDAMLHLQQPETDPVPLHCWVDVELPDLDIDVTSAPTVAGPLDVTIRIRNHGDSTRLLDVRLVGQTVGSQPNQRITLAPGDTGGHRFLVHLDPSTPLADTIHAHIAEVEASGRVRVAITLPTTTDLATVDPLTP